MIYQGGSSVAAIQTNCGLKVVSWNIERGLQLPSVKAALDEMQPSIALRQEVDLNAWRSGRANVAEQLAKSLGMKYIFAVEFEELGQGNVNEPAYHGQALLAAFPIASSRIIRFQNQTSFWNPHWYVPNWAMFQRRIGGRLALVAEIDVGPNLLIVYNQHLESRGDERLRLRQIQEVIIDVQQYTMGMPIFVAGDFNTQKSDELAVKAMLQAGFHQEVGQEVTTIRGNTLDRIIVRGQITLQNLLVHRQVRASDHYPLSMRIENKHFCDSP